MELVHEYLQRDVMVCIVKLRAELRQLFQRSGLVDMIGAPHFYSKIQDAVHAIQIASDVEVVVERVTSASSTKANASSTTLPFRRALPKASTEEFPSFPSSSTKPT